MELRKGFDAKLLRQSDNEDLNRSMEEPSCKTSFLIEDILFRGNRNKPFDRRQERRDPDQESLGHYEATRSSSPKRVGFQGCYGLNEGHGFRPAAPTGMAGHEGYIQVAMGALGAYLNTGPGPYKSVDTPYFLSQGMCILISI